jgi:putative ABC transport system permease protein
MRDRLNPTFGGIRLGTLAHLYARRLRSDALGELLAGTGIAVGVALVFGVLLASTSITGSADELVHGVIGQARLSLVARSADGMPERLAERVSRLPGVQTASPVLQENAAIVGASGRQTVQMIGVTPGIVTLGGAATKNLNASTLLAGEGLGLPSYVANLVGARTGRAVRVLANGESHRVDVQTVLDNTTAGSASQSPVAVGLLGTVQRLTGRPGRVSQILVEPALGMDGAVRRELRRLAAGRLDVVAADNELRQLRTTAAPSEQATTLFAAIGGMVGFLLAFNAMLLTVPGRRRTIADLRMQGFDWRQALLVIGFEALTLGIVASVAGIALGALASHAFLHRVPVYLAFAFPIGSQQAVHLTTLLPAIGCGLCAALFASLPAASDLRPSRPRDAVLRMGETDGATIARELPTRLAVVGAGLLVALSLSTFLAPALTLLSGVLLAVAVILVLPAAFTVFGRLATYVNERLSSTALLVAVRELRQIGMRTIALSGVAALAIFGSVAIGGARHDLVAGSDVNFAEYLGTADLWITTGSNDLTTNSFKAPLVARRLAALSGVASVRRYQGELMDIGARRMWIIGRPTGDRTIVPASQVMTGDAQRADRLVRQGGWMTVSRAFADEHHLRVGNTYALPTPSGAAPERIAAVTTNLGWPSGTVILSNVDYSRYWQTADPSALEIDLRPGVSEVAGQRAVARVLAATPGLSVQTRAERRARYASNSRQALASLQEISLLLLIAAALAVATALSTAIWQRRSQLASLKLQGYDHRQLWRALLMESTIMLGIGSAVGAVLGMYGHLLATRWLRLSTGFPAPFSLGLGGMLFDFALVAGIALLVIAIPGLAAARVSPRVALQET